MPRDRVETSLKRATAEEKRRAMTARRHEYSQQIRKQKKSQFIALKRRYNADTSSTITQTPSTTSSLPDLCRNYIARRDMVSLTALSSAIATSTTAVLELQDEQEQLQLANTLAHSLKSNASLEERLLASRILTNLAAMNTSLSIPDDASYYSKQPQGWCQVLIQSQALPALASSLASFAIQVDPSFMSSDGPLLQVCAQSCWAVGNLAGDSQVARDAARQAGVVPSLCSVLSRGLQLQHTSVCRNAAWALSNLTRGVVTSGKEFCGPTLLTPALLASVLMSPEQEASATIQTSWWGEVAKEACWILAFLTARENEVVDYLCQPTQKDLAWMLAGNTNIVCAALAHRLQQASGNKSLQSTVQLRAMQMTIPCLRSIGNIATACEGQHVGTLLKETCILESLKILIKAGCEVRNGDVAAVAVEAAWAAGTLLCDAGIQQHPSTILAAPALLATLCQVVVDGSAKLDLKREAVAALWNAVSAPPNEGLLGDASTSRPIRDEFLRNIAQVPGMITSLTALLTSTDADAVLNSIQLLNAMLRRLGADMPRVKLEFMEADGVDALEAVCDGASQDAAYGGGRDWNAGSTSSESAEIAADLIDDLFSDQDGDQEMTIMAVPDSFTFSPIAIDQTQTFDFSGPPQQQQQRMGAFPDASDGTSAGGGRGRGRGRPIPSWMQQSSEHDSFGV